MYFCIMKQAIIDKRTLETILSDQRSEIESRKEEQLIDQNSPQAQVVIGMRRCGKPTLCFKTLKIDHCL